MTRINNTDIKLKKESKDNKINTEKDFEDDNENNEDDDGDNKIINLFSSGINVPKLSIVCPL